MKNILGILFILSFVVGTNFYIAKRIYQGAIVLFPNISVLIYAVLYIFVMLLVIVGYAPHSYKLKNVINGFASYWLGSFVYLLIFFLIFDITMLLGNMTQVISSPMPYNIRFWSALIVILAATVLMIYGKFKAAQIKHVSYDIELKNFTKFGELKIAMIADLHLGASYSVKNLPKIIQGINDLKPDIVCMVGDIFSDDINLIRNPGAVKKLFRSIKATHGVYACLGNHDGGLTFNEMINFLEESNITLLNDEYTIIDDRLILIGRVDASPLFGFDGLKRSDIADIMTSVNSELPIIVMDHNPLHIEEYGKEFDLLLFGHTHKGQMFPGNLIINSMYVSDYGYYQKNADSPHTIVTSGVSTWGPPIRIGTNNEIVSIAMRINSNV